MAGHNCQTVITSAYTHSTGDVLDVFSLINKYNKYNVTEKLCEMVQDVYYQVTSTHNKVSPQVLSLMHLPNEFLHPVPTGC